MHEFVPEPDRLVVVQAGGLIRALAWPSRVPKPCGTVLEGANCIRKR